MAFLVSTNPAARFYLKEAHASCIMRARTAATPRQRARALQEARCCRYDYVAVFGGVHYATRRQLQVSK